MAACNKSLLAALLMSLLLASNVFVECSRHGIQEAGSCSTPDACTKSPSDLQSILIPCLGDAQGSSTPKPGDSCCTGILSLDPSCLCNALKVALNSPLLGVNTDDALAMPSKCGYKVPQNCVCDEYINDGKLMMSLWVLKK